MKRFLSVIIVASAVLMLSWGCFKTVVAYTIFRIAVYEQVEQNGEIVDVEVVYNDNYVEQMLHYSKEYSFLPTLN